MAIKLLITGGTFDKDYDELTGKLYFHDTHVHEMLRLGRCRLETRVRTVMMVDSLEMTDSDREILREVCRQVRGGPDRRHARHRHDGRDGEGPRRGRASRRRSS